MNKFFGSLLIFIFFFQYSNSQTTDSLTDDTVRLVSITELPDSIMLSHDTIGFSLKSEIDDVLFYSISLEEKIGDQWFVLVKDMLWNQHDRHRAQNMRILLSFEEKTYTWNLNEIFRPGFRPLGACRFKCMIKDSPFNHRETIYSDSFLLPLAND